VPPSRHSREINAGAWPLALAALLPTLAAAATPTPHPDARPARVDVTKVQPKSLLPKKAEHTEYVVDINKLGQVTRIDSKKSSDSATFNAQTYGNALQTFIRTPDGGVVLGSYRLTYDFDPKTARVRRDVTLVHQGGVNPDATGAADDLMAKSHAQAISPKISPTAGAAIDPRSLPDLNRVIAPTATPQPR
jgi:hypothetical protein